MTAWILASSDAMIRAITLLPADMPMRTTLAIDDDLLAKARLFTGLNEKSAIVREALKALIERESARRLARLGGTDPDAVAAPRRRATND